MKMLPPLRPALSSCSISARVRARRAGLSARTSTLLERGSATTDTRCCGSAAAPGALPESASSRLSTCTRSIADALRRGTMIGSPAGGTSSEAMIRSMRCRLSA